MPLYSRYATREAWLLDLTRNRLEATGTRPPRATATSAWSSAASR